MFLEIRNPNEAHLFPQTLEEMMGMRNLRMESERNRQGEQASVVLTRKIREMGSQMVFQYREIA